MSEELRKELAALRATGQTALARQIEEIYRQCPDGKGRRPWEISTPSGTGPRRRK